MGPVCNTTRQLVLKRRRSYRKTTRLKQYPPELALINLGLTDKLALEKLITNFGINNITNETFPEDVLKILGLGLKFIPTPYMNTDGLIYDVMNYTRLIKLRTLFNDNSQRKVIEKLRVPNPTYEPDSTLIPTRVKSICDDILNTAAVLVSTENVKSSSDTLQNTKRFKHNMNPILIEGEFPKVRSNINLISWRKTLNVIRDPKYVIKPADKNLGLTIMTDKWYCNEVLSQLSDEKTYLKLNINDFTNEWFNVIKSIRKKEFKALLKEAINKIKKEAQKPISVPEFYILPKLHKNPIKGRPIVPSHSWITSTCSRVLDFYLQPILAAYPQILSNSTQLILEIEKLDPSKKYDFVTGDISSLYTNIPTNYGIQCISKVIRRFYANNNRLQDELIWLLEFVLQNNGFRFRNQHYWQINGTAMGTSCAPTYANLFMAALEEKLKLRTNNATLWYRYIDDIIIIWEKDKPGLTNLMHDYNAQHEDISINWEQEENTAFLDLSIKQDNDGKILIQTHTKTTSRFLYIPSSSFHPKAQKKAFIKTELIRFLRTNNTLSGYVTKKHAFYGQLRARGYSPRFLVPLFKKILYGDRSKYLIFKRKDYTPINEERRKPFSDYEKGLREVYGTLYGENQRLNLIVENNPAINLINWNNLLYTQELKDQKIISEKPRIVKKSPPSLLQYVNKANRHKFSSTSRKRITVEAEAYKEEVAQELPTTIDLTNDTEDQPGPSKPAKKPRLQ